MSKKTSVAVAFVGLCALSLLLLSCGSSSSRPSGILYVLTQGTNSQGPTGYGNNVSSFAIDLNTGNLSLINSNASTCPTAATNANPEPCGIPLQILLDPTGATAFVLNQGIASASPPVPPTINSYTVNSDGSLGSPNLAATLTTGDIPIAMARDAAGQFLFVIDEGTDPSAANCQYQPPNNLPNIQCASISVFAMKSGSTSLSEAAGSPFPVGRIPSALSPVSFTPTSPPGASAQEFLYVTFNSDPALHNDSTLSAYSVDSSGNLTDLTPDTPYVTATNPISVQAVNTFTPGENTSGVFVYVGSQANQSGALSVFQVCTVESSVCQSVDPSELVPVGTPTSLGQNPVAMLVDPTNSFLYVACYISNQIYGYLINATRGTLTSLSNSPQPSQGSEPVSMAMHPSVNDLSQYLYVSNSNSQSIAGFTVSTTTGSMSSPITVIAPAAPSGMAAD
jgi:hypothetical protein